MRDDGPNVAAAGANIGAYAIQKAVRTNLDKASADNIVAVPISVNGYNNPGKTPPSVMYMEKGLCVEFTDANGKKVIYTIGDDGKIRDAKNNIVSTMAMDANQYAVLDAMSKEAREATAKTDKKGHKTDVNDRFDVLTSQDIREAEDSMHPYSDKDAARLNNPDAQKGTAQKVRGSISSTGGDKTVTLDIAGGHKDDVDSKNGKFTVKLVEGTTVKNDAGTPYHPKAGSVSIFMKK